MTLKNNFKVSSTIKPGDDDASQERFRLCQRVFTKARYGGEPETDSRAHFSYRCLQTSY
jgi:hypothetical protein